ncbi:MAG TPA: hypothetical protein PKU97_24865, partial [Kofleriaceae bacterium]|nr:hypothetical protein [Kofleriaceae bacterium]
WLRYAGPELLALSPPERIRQSAFLLSIGLAGTDGAAARLIARTFGDVYRAASRYSLPDESWNWMSDDLPPLHWYRSWDKCERLVLGLVSRFVRENWALEDFFRAAAEPEVLRQAIDVANERQEALELLRRIHDGYKRGTLSLSRSQRDVLDDRL